MDASSSPRAVTRVTCASASCASLKACSAWSARRRSSLALSASSARLRCNTVVRAIVDAHPAGKLIELTAQAVRAREKIRHWNSGYRLRRSKHPASIAHRRGAAEASGRMKWMELHGQVRRAVHEQGRSGGEGAGLASIHFAGLAYAHFFYRNLVPLMQHTKVLLKDSQKRVDGDHWHGLRHRGCGGFPLIIIEDHNPIRN